MLGATFTAVIPENPRSIQYDIVAIRYGGRYTSLTDLVIFLSLPQFFASRGSRTMSSNRLASCFTDHRPARFSFGIAASRPVAAPQPAFAICPTALVASGNPARLAWQMALYQQAYEQARATVEARNRARAATYLWN